MNEDNFNPDLPNGHFPGLKELVESNTKVAGIYWGCGCSAARAVHTVTKEVVWEHREYCPAHAPSPEPL